MTKKDDLKEFKKCASDNFDNHNISDDILYPKYIIKTFLNDILDDDIDSGFYGLGSNDGGVDFFYHEEENDTMHLFQFKTTNSTSLDLNIDDRDLIYFGTFIDNIQNEEWLKTKSNAVKSIASDIKNCKTNIVKKYFFIMTDNIKDKHISLAKQYDIELCGWGDIFKIHRNFIERTSPDEYTDGECYIHSSGETSFQQIKSTDTIYSWFGVINAKDLIDMYNTFGYKLFDQNVRYSLGSSKVNEGMSKTIKNTGESKKFYYYNNGITITCSTSSSNTDKTRLTIKSPSIINGAQTVNTIVKENKNIENINILCRVINRSDTLHAFIKNLTEYNNTHNPVKEIDFLSKRPEQIALYEKFKNVNIFYEYKRGILNQRAEHKILNREYKLNISKLMQILASTYKEPEPHLAKNIKEILEISVGTNLPHSKYFYFIFGEEIGNLDKIGQDRLSERRFKEILLAAKLYYEIEKNIKFITSLIKKKNNNQEILEAEKTDFAKRFLTSDDGISEKINDFLSNYYYIVDSAFVILTMYWYVIHKAQYLDIFINLSDETIQSNVGRWFIKIIAKYMSSPCQNIKEKNINFKSYFKTDKAWNDIESEIKKINLYDDIKELFKIQ